MKRAKLFLAFGMCLALATTALAGDTDHGNFATMAEYLAWLLGLGK